MSALLARLHASVLVKLAFIGFLVLVLLIPMSMVERVIHERQAQRAAAKADIMRAFGGEQVVGGPLLVVPYRVPVRGENGQVTGWHRSCVYLLPRDVAIDGSLTPEYRYRGLHRVPVYTAVLDVTARFAPPAPQALLAPDAVLLWDRATIALHVADARAIKSPVGLRGDLGERDFVPGDVALPGTGPMLVAPVPDLAERARGASEPADLRVSLRLHLAGSERLAVLPLGDETRVALDAPWPSPSFEGGWLPETRQVDDAGFDARWRVLHLGRGFPSAWRAGAVDGDAIAASAFGVRLYQAASVYQQAVRAAKYAVLFIGASFLVWFMLEVHCARLLHPLQYLLIGFANCLFYLLLVSLSEHVGFTAAYLLAAVASTGLVAGYSASVLASRRLAGLVAGLLALTYGFLLVTLRAEDFALLTGALGLFVALATVMYVTRRVDWYRVSLGKGEPAGARAG